jgi:hypothetical protein
MSAPKSSGVIPVGFAGMIHELLENTPTSLDPDIVPALPTSIVRILPSCVFTPVSRSTETVLMPDAPKKFSVDDAKLVQPVTNEEAVVNPEKYDDDKALL